MQRLRSVFSLVMDAVRQFQEDGATRLAEALSYFAVFSLAPLVIVVLALVTLFVDAETARTQLLTQFGGLVGEQGAEFVATILQATNEERGAGIVATVVGLGTALLGAVGVFRQLKDALNIVFNVAPGDKPQGVRALIMTNLLSFGMVLGVGFMLLVSLVVSAVLSGINQIISGLGAWPVVAQALNTLVSVGIITLLFALIYRFVPDVRLSWRSIWVGAFVTALLFNFGKWLIGLYLGNSTIGSTYGAAGSLAILLVWIFYSAQIFMFGAEITQAYAQRYGALARAEAATAPSGPMPVPTAMVMPISMAPQPLERLPQAPLTPTRRPSPGQALLAMAAVLVGSFLFGRE